MKNSQQEQIIEAIERISRVTRVAPSTLIDALTGIAWDEEDAGEMKEILRGEDTQP